jgi:hypothetical protein
MPAIVAGDRSASPPSSSALFKSQTTVSPAFSLVPQPLSFSALSASGGIKDAALKGLVDCSIPQSAATGFPRRKVTSAFRFANASRALTTAGSGVHRSGN